ncbi:MAG: hypothetical protein CL529_12070 [Aequorivita sp.]|nr:hypothetical protein [Aequorivita sp.]|tara:strand:+ start:3893 stop:5170 length:1278 start_codon:yes stop_codon:yes gene_type:complete
MKHITLLLLIFIPTVILSVDYLAVPMNDIIAGSHKLSADGSQFEKIVTQSLVTSTGNTSTAILTNGSTFTGTGEKNQDSHFGVSVKTDQDGILYTDFSNDGTNWDSTFPPNGFQVTGGIHEFHTGVKLGRYFRVRFYNDSGSDQTYLRLYTYYGNNFVPSNAPANQSIGIDTDATSVRPTNFNDEVLIGRRSGITHFNKFGYREGLTASSGEQTVWATTGNFTPMTTASTFTITYDNTADGSTANGAKTLYFVYIDDDGISQIGLHTLGSSGSDVTSFSGLGINRVAVSVAGSTQANGGDIAITDTTGATTQAFMPEGDGTTQQAIFHTDANSDAVAKYLKINTNKLSGSSPKVTIKGYVFNRQFEIRFEVFRVTLDSSTENTVSMNEPIGFKLSPTDVLYFVADTDTNSAFVNVRFSLLEYKRD